MPVSDASWRAAAARVEARFPGFLAESLLRRTGKAVILAGTYAGTVAVAKVLTTRERVWREKFAREAAAYGAFTADAPPVHVPRLLAGDSDSGVMILQRVPGEPLHVDRYPPALPLPTVQAAVDTLALLADWRPSMFLQVWDYPERLDRYRAHGLLDHDDHQALTRLLERAGPDRHVAHGDPLPANILHHTADDTTGITLVDWEFAGFYLPHHDQALLWALLASTPGARRLIERRVARHGPRHVAAFTVSRALILARELRMHREALPAAWARRRLDAVERDWTQLRDQVRGMAFSARQP
ncbi:aminoglycoside phosphotransferase family protein [Streptomyces sp. NPDC049585]|uniref:aminoglycoside phosphotransferase family protein n=1 Tax=Streptomyces sp. NPDC049585 TaxID=3155154 RepID=UPI0034412577